MLTCISLPAQFRCTSLFQRGVGPRVARLSPLYKQAHVLFGMDTCAVRCLRAPGQCFQICKVHTIITNEQGVWENKHAKTIVRICLFKHVYGKRKYCNPNMMEVIRSTSLVTSEVILARHRRYVRWRVVTE